MIKAIETRYAGCRFRSRLEARWAVFFDHLGVKWEYEPEGLELPNGQRYLPDFRIEVNLGLYVEVKGSSASLHVGRLADFLDGSGCDRSELLILGPVPRPMTALHWMIRRIGTSHYLARVAFACTEKEPLKIEQFRREEPLFVADHLDVTEAEQSGWLGAVPPIRDAYEAARSARFEHGESGAVV